MAETHDSMRLGFDIGATKIRAVAFSPERVPIGYDETSRTPEDYVVFTQLLQRHVEEAERILNRRASFVGFAIPGYFAADGRLVAANITCASGEKVKEDVAKLIGLERNLKWENDANCFAISEFHAYVDGHYFEKEDVKITGESVIMGAILGSGLGSGIIDGNGRVTHGLCGFAGEVGHLSIPSNAIFLLEKMNMKLPRQCGCKLWNCCDMFLSGRGFELLYASYFKQPSPPSQDVIASCMKEEPQAVEFVELFLHLLAHFFATVIAVLDPHAVIFGGGLGGFLPKPLLVKLRHKLEPLILGSPPVFLPPLEGPSSGVRGAAFQRV